MKRLVNHWRTQFNWRDEEIKLNKLPNYEVEVSVEGFGALEMHFVHQKSKVTRAIPLLFCHGWPGSFLEVSKLLPLLTGENGPAFHVVAPSMPNYGFSGAMLKRGFSIKQYAESMHKVMMALGYEQYVVQGGDWGHLVARTLAYLYPQHCMAHLTNWAWAAKPEEFENGTTPEPEYSEREKRQMELGEQWLMGDGMGYMAIQGTRPRTINFAFRDSPVALLSWIYDKLHEWSDEYRWTDDEVCLWVSLHLFSRAGPDAASYIYYEQQHDTTEITTAMLSGYIDTPLGIADFPVEVCLVSW